MQWECPGRVSGDTEGIEVRAYCGADVKGKLCRLWCPESKAEELHMHSLATALKLLTTKIYKECCGVSISTGPASFLVPIWPKRTIDNVQSHK